MTDLQMLGVLETLVRLSRAGALPSAALTTTAGVHRGAREELAKLGNAAAVEGLRRRLREKVGVFSPEIVKTAADMLDDPKKAFWLCEIGRLAGMA